MVNIWKITHIVHTENFKRNKKIANEKKKLQQKQQGYLHLQWLMWKQWIMKRA